MPVIHNLLHYSSQVWGSWTQIWVPEISGAQSKTWSLVPPPRPPPATFPLPSFGQRTLYHTERPANCGHGWLVRSGSDWPSQNSSLGEETRWQESCFRSTVNPEFYQSSPVSLDTLIPCISRPKSTGYKSTGVLLLPSLPCKPTIDPPLQLVLYMQSTLHTK